MRADFGKGEPPPLIGTWEKPRPAMEQLPGLVELALRLGPAPAHKVWILSSDLWVQTLAMARNAVEGVETEELRKALGFEVEPLSGMGAFDSEIAFRQLPARGNDSSFWVMQAESIQRDPLEDIIAREHGKFAGLVSAAGLPKPLFEQEEGGSWQRIELWPTHVVCLNHVAGEELDVHIINEAPRQNRWREQVEAWLNQVGDASEQEWLTATDLSDVVEESDTPEPMSLDDQETLEIWLTVWASALSQPDPAVPHVAPKRRPASMKQKAMLCVALWLVVAALCGVRWMTLSSSVDEARKYAEEVKRNADSLSPLRATENRLKKEKKTLNDDSTKLEDRERNMQTMLRSYRDRYGILLGLLGQYAPDPSVLTVDEIVSFPNSLEIKGRSIDSQLISSLASGLAEHLPKYGWVADLPTKEAQNKLPNGGPWAFRIKIRDVEKPAMTTGGRQ